MRAKSLELLNRQTGALYKAVYLKDTLEDIGVALGIRGKYVKQRVRALLNAAEKDDRVLRSVSMRAQYEERRINEEYEEFE